MTFNPPGSVEIWLSGAWRLWISYWAERELPNRILKHSQISQSLEGGRRTGTKEQVGLLAQHSGRIKSNP